MSMAIFNKETGNYLKVVRDLTVFTPRSVKVTFYDFKSRKDRDLYFLRQAQVEKFLKHGNAQVKKWFEEFNGEVANYARGMGLEELNSVSELPDVMQERYNELSAVSAFLRDLSFDWERGVSLPKDKQVANDLLVLGFMSDWSEPLSPTGLVTVHTGTFSNQDFSYACLYSELKKVYRGYVDC